MIKMEEYEKTLQTADLTGQDERITEAVHGNSKCSCLNTKLLSRNIRYHPDLKSGASLQGIRWNRWLTQQ